MVEQGCNKLRRCCPTLHTRLQQERAKRPSASEGGQVLRSVLVLGQPELLCLSLLPTPHSATSTSATMLNPTLPPELLNIIIPLAIPSPSRASLRERTSTLCALSLVNSTWHAYARPRLWSHLRLTDKRLRALARELKLAKADAPSGSRARAAGEVKTVSLGRWIDGYGAGLKTTLKEFSEVEEAYLEGTTEWASLSTVAVLPSELPWSAELVRNLY